jgi:hypothetical protein
MSRNYYSEINLHMVWHAVEKCWNGKGVTV